VATGDWDWTLNQHLGNTLNERYDRWLKEREEAANKKAVCPTCGACPTCGKYRESK